MYVLTLTFRKIFNFNQKYDIFALGVALVAAKILVTDGFLVELGVAS